MVGNRAPARKYNQFEAVGDEVERDVAMVRNV